MHVAGMQAASGYCRLLTVLQHGMLEHMHAAASQAPNIH
jgi:hypothetical protein